MTSIGLVIVARQVQEKEIEKTKKTHPNVTETKRRKCAQKSVSLKLFSNKIKHQKKLFIELHIMAMMFRMGSNSPVNEKR